MDIRGIFTFTFKFRLAHKRLLMTHAPYLHKELLGAKPRHLFMRIALTECRPVDRAEIYTTNSYPYPEAPWKKR